MSTYTYEVTLKVDQAYVTVDALKTHEQEVKDAFERRIKEMGVYKGTVSSTVTLKEVKPAAESKPVAALKDTAPRG